MSNKSAYKYPKLIATSVIRSVKENESHGGVYLIDTETGETRQVIDWNDCNIDWKGRGGDRGLRGIAFYENKIYIAASDEIFVLDKDFNRIKSYKNKYLKHCHEIFINKNKLYLTSTGYDSILEFNLDKGEFIKGYYIKQKKDSLDLKVFNPEQNNGPEQKDTLHINNVGYFNGKIYFSGTCLDKIYFIHKFLGFKSAKPYMDIPLSTHNTQPYNDGIIYNDTAGKRIIYKNSKIIDEFHIIEYEKEKMLNTDLPEDHAVQAFGRGLCFKDDLIFGGSSPATISVYKQGKPNPIKTINLTMDIRNSIHGLEIWPFETFKINEVNQ